MATQRNYFASEAWSNYLNEVRRRVHGNWDQVFMTLVPDAMEPAMNRAPRHVPCPRHGGTDGFRCYSDFRTTGGTVCNTCGPNKDGFATLQWLTGWTFSEAVKAVGDVLGVQYEKGRGGVRTTTPKVVLAPPPPPKSAAEIAREDAQKAKRLMEVWNGSVGLLEPAGAPARAYLERRCLKPLVGPLEDLRVHPGLDYYENKTLVGTFPALLCLLRQANAQPCTLQRIYLTEDGLKAPVDTPKKVMPYRSTVQYAGSAVRLDHQIGTVICVAEGVETALAWRAMTGLPTWAGCVAGLMENMVLPESVQVVLGVGDRDLPSRGAEQGRGQQAADTLIERVKATGRKAAVFLPPFAPAPGAVKGVDWADVLQAFGQEAARQQPFAVECREQVRQVLESLGLSWESSNAHF
jgi:putative DNA primase/helicase